MLRMMYLASLDIIFCISYTKKINVHTKKIFQRIQFLREILIKTFATLNIALDFDGMKSNMSAIIKSKENTGSSC